SYQSTLARWRYRRDFDLLAIRETVGKGQIDLEEAAEDVAWALKAKPGAVDVLLAAADLERLRGRAALERPGDAPLAERERPLQEHRRRAADSLQRGLEQLGKRPTPGADHTRFQLLWHKANLVLDELDRLDGKGEAAAAGRKGALAAEVREAIEAM